MRQGAAPSAIGGGREVKEFIDECAVEVESCAAAVGSAAEVVAGVKWEECGESKRTT